MTEFRALRAEQDMRVSRQQDISQLALGLLGVSLALTGTLVTHGDGVADVRGLCPLLVVVLCGLLLMTLDHEMNIAHIQIYVQKRLGPRLAETLDISGPEEVPFWHWVGFRAARQQHPGWASPLTLGIASAKYWTTLIPSLGLLVAYPFLCSGRPDPWYAWTGYGLVVGMWLFALAASIYTGRLYLQMDHEHVE